MSSTVDRLEKYRLEYLRWLKRKAKDPLVTEPDRRQFPGHIQSFVDNIRQQCEEEVRL